MTFQVSGRPYGPPSPLRTVRAGCPEYGSSIGQRIRGRPRVASGTAPAVDENPSGISGGGVAAHHDGGIAALLDVRIEDRLAGRAPAQLGYLGESPFLH